MYILILCFIFLFQMYERMNVCDALTSQTFKDKERIIAQVRSAANTIDPRTPDTGGLAWWSPW